MQKSLVIGTVKDKLNKWKEIEGEAAFYFFAFQEEHSHIVLRRRLQSAFITHNHAALPHINDFPLEKELKKLYNLKMTKQKIPFF